MVKRVVPRRAGVVFSLILIASALSSLFSFNVSGDVVTSIDSCGVAIDHPGFYVIASDLYVMDGVCLTVRTSGVVIDGAGRVITGSGRAVGILVTASYVNITNVVLENLEIGIFIVNSSYILVDATRVVNVTYGVSLMNSNRVVLLNNVFINSGLVLANSSSNVVVNNTVNGKPLVYLENARDVEVRDAGQIIVVSSEKIRVRDVVIGKTPVGVLAISSRYIVVSNVTISRCEVAIALRGVSLGFLVNSTLVNNRCGLEMSYSSEIIVINNTFENNAVGLFLVNASGNTLFLNDFVNTRNYLGIGVSENTWYSPVEMDYIYVPTNTSHRSRLGNFWSTCRVVDENGDGINDNYCELDERNIDYFPLASRRLNYRIARPQAPTPTQTVTSTPRTITPVTETPPPRAAPPRILELDEVARAIVPVTVAFIAISTLITIFVLTNKFRKTK